ncbi:MAG TPA: envelope stress response membrane protein PspC [Sphingobium sp.]|nr:envelope stress response membrane protein PspC [Sphingobium sp.]
MLPRRTRFYLDKQNAKWLGVCSGLADYTGLDVMWIRVAAVLLAVCGAGSFVIPAYFIIAWLAQPKPSDLYFDEEDARFWQRTRVNPKRTTREVKSKFRDIDRRLADIETFYTSRNQSLADEIERLR